MSDHLQGKDSYEDIIYRSRPVSEKHPKMSISDRAAQFSPFAALTGHDAAIKETARETGHKIMLDESTACLLNERLQLIRVNIQSHPTIQFTYFVSDERKDGGEYVTYTGNVKKISEVDQLIYLEDGTYIRISDIVEVEGELFNQIF